MMSHVAEQRQLSSAACRLCGGALTPRFSLRVLHQHQVAYMACGSCGSLQTEIPHWLDEAYSHNLSNLDTGAAQRNLKNMAACYIVARVLKLNRLIDMGGGDGLLCRLLRDHGLDCYVRDKFAHPTYAQGFDQPDFEVPDMVSAFEVFEHLPNPALELETFFAQRPKVVLVSTELYSGQGANWAYLAPEGGQHVFFYSVKALELVAQQFGYALVRGGDFGVFVRADAVAGWHRWVLRWLLRPRVCRWTAALMLLRATPGVMRDHEKQKLRAVGTQLKA